MASAPHVPVSLLVDASLPGRPVALTCQLPPELDVPLPVKARTRWRPRAGALWAATPPSPCRACVSTSGRYVRTRSNCTEVLL
eukprot:CAMPEP_0172920880 /NCGR_PEP_ID=MMETSP1075-20121228/204899_1 /TAXON_ID=2916 /ORGANISM="Ceratium fusus, Strain PA161109" /LENGTH=82 /DNA_ID=CAMNT_0013780969 /DNA_START=110 /DNA_END=358 /DNA_ORIENTATION=+